MELSIKLSKSEAAVLKASFEQKREALRDMWDVDTFEGYVSLLAVHGYDHSGELFRKGR